MLLLSTCAQVVYVSDSAGYIPVTPIRSSRHPQAPPPQVSSDYRTSSTSYGGGGPGGSGVDLEQWRPELWDRDYSRRYRHNNTRVQRKWSCLLRIINCGHLLKVRHHVLCYSLLGGCAIYH